MHSNYTKKHCVQAKPLQVSLHRLTMEWSSRSLILLSTISGLQAVKFHDPSQASLFTFQSQLLTGGSLMVHSDKQ